MFAWLRGSGGENLDACGSVGALVEPDEVFRMEMVGGSAGEQRAGSSV